MKKILGILFLSLLLIGNAFASKVGSKDKVVAALKKGGSIVFIRHAYAPRINNKFEPDDFYIYKMIISIGRGNVSKKKKQLKKIRKYIEKWDSNKNLIIVSHFNVINPLFEKSLLSIGSGEIVVSDKNFNILGNWKVPY